MGAETCNDSVFSYINILSVVQKSRENIVRKSEYIWTWQKKSVLHPPHLPTPKTAFLGRYLDYLYSLYFALSCVPKHTGKNLLVEYYWYQSLVEHNLCSFQNIRACWEWIWVGKKQKQKKATLPPPPPFLLYDSINIYPMQFSPQDPVSLKFSFTNTRDKDMDNSECIKQNWVVDPQHIVIVTL